MTKNTAFAAMPDEHGYFGDYGGQLVPPKLKQVMDGIDCDYVADRLQL